MGLLENRVAAEMAQWQGFTDAKLAAEKISENLARPPRAEMGDLAFATFRFAKDAGMKPPELAQKLVKGAGAGILVESAAAAGPYVNITLNRSAAFNEVLGEIESKSPGDEPAGWHYGDSDEGRGKTLVVDLSSPNIAKPLAVHHLRSTMIGYSIKKLRESQGWRVIGINHLGDWGTGFGKLIAGIKKYFPGIAQGAAQNADNCLGNLTVNELNRAYQEFNSTSELDGSNLGAKEFSLLETFNHEHLKGNQAISLDGEMKEAHVNWNIWRDVRALSLSAFDHVYERLGIKFRHLPINWASSLFEGYHADKEEYRQELENVRNWFDGKCIVVGESAFADGSPYPGKITEQAKRSGAAKESEGATVVFPFGEESPPLFLIKSDGATSYHVRDMASALFRHDVLGTDEIAYVVGAEQKLHFKQLFAALEMLGYDWAKNCSHVDFGLMLFKQEDGTWAKSSTRKGTAVMLEDLLDETVQVVRDIISEKNPELAADQDEAERTAQAVGVGAVVFNDLKNGRRNNVKFDWDKVLDFQGETGPYMQMQYVRMGSAMQKFIERYGELEPVAPATGVPAIEEGNPEKLTLNEEWTILHLLASWPDTVARASRDFEPSIVARHLVDLAAATSTWWAATRDTRIVGDDKDLSLARVRLVNGIRKVLGHGLQLLGMQTVERM